MKVSISALPAVVLTIACQISSAGSKSQFAEDYPAPNPEAKAHAAAAASTHTVQVQCAQDYTRPVQEFEFSVPDKELSANASRSIKNGVPYTWGLTADESGQAFVIFGKTTHGEGISDTRNYLKGEVTGLRVKVNPTIGGSTLEGVYMVAEVEGHGLVLCAKKTGDQSWKLGQRCQLQLKGGGTSLKKPAGQEKYRVYSDMKLTLSINP